MISSSLPAARPSMHRTTFGPVAFLFMAAAFACAKEPAGPPPNVLLISFDSTRRDILSSYGHSAPYAPGVATSPQVDRLASEGVRFEQAYSTTSWTLPAHMTLMTGLPELAHAVELDNLELAPEHRTLAEILQQDGYLTAGFYSGPYLAPNYGFGRGFDRYEAMWSEELKQALEDLKAVEAEEADLPKDAGRAPREQLFLRKKDAIDRIETRSHRDITSMQITDAALDVVRAARGGDRPWFLFLHYFDPHYDYVAPGDHSTRFDPDYAGDMDGRDFIDNPRVSEQTPLLANPKAHKRVIGERDLEHVRALYDGELSWTDEQLGRLLDELRESGELDDTLVVFLSDHGDEFFEHGNLGHRKNLYEESVQVPLVLRYPKALPQGKSVSGVVTLADVSATIYDLIGLEPVIETPSRSLVPLARGKESKSTDRHALGRLVDVREVSEALLPGQPGMQVLIDEYYLRWPIKILRRRYRVDPLGAESNSGSGAENGSAVHGEMRIVDFLKWIDLEEFPHEPLDEYSDKFSDARAKAALEEYSRYYEQLLSRRLQPTLSSGGANPQMLDALGYGGGMGLDDASMIQRFTIEPPGK